MITASLLKEGHRFEDTVRHGEHEYKLTIEYVGPGYKVTLKRAELVDWTPGGLHPDGHRTILIQGYPSFARAELCFWRMLHDIRRDWYVDWTALA